LDTGVASNPIHGVSSRSEIESMLLSSFMVGRTREPR
jgi:hypothetical protein